MKIEYRETPGRTPLPSSHMLRKWRDTFPPQGGKAKGASSPPLVGEDGAKRQAGGDALNKRKRGGQLGNCNALKTGRHTAAMKALGAIVRERLASARAAIEATHNGTALDVSLDDRDEEGRASFLDARPSVRSG